jgi:diguanylate cyclase (GGDEF)-like protein/PAS domain S-box-containing protein
MSVPVQKRLSIQPTRRKVEGAGQGWRGVDTGNSRNGPQTGRHRAGDRLGSGRIIVAVLNRLARASSAEADIAIDAALADLGKAAGFDRTYVFCLRDDCFLDNTHEWAAPGIVPMRDRLQGLPVDMVAHWQDDFARDRPVFIPRVEDLPPDRPEREILIEQDIRSILVVPMFGQGKWIGFVGYDAVRAEASLRDEHVDLLQSAANGIAALLMRKRAENALEESRFQLAATLAAVPDLLLEFDNDGRYRAVHSDRHDTLRIAPAALIGRRMEDVVTPELAALQRRMMAEIDRTGRTAPETYSYDLPDGLHWFEMIAAPRQTAHSGLRDGYIFLVRDITDRKEAETALQAREALLANLFQHAPIGILLTDWETGALADVNPAFMAALGRDRRDLDAGPVGDFLAPDQKHYAESSVRDLTESGRYGPYETFFVDKDKCSTPVSVSGVLMRDTQGRRLVWSFVVDLAEQHSKDAALRARTREALESRERLEAALDAFPDALVLFDAEDRLILYNQQYPALYPAVADAIFPGAALSDIIQTGLDRRMYASLNGHPLPTLKELLHHDPVARDESEVELSDGRIIRIIEKTTADGGRIGLRSDVTAARRAEWRLTNVVEGAQVGTWEWNIETGANIVNERWAEMAGYALADLMPVTIDTWRLLVFPEDLAGSTDKILAVLEGRVAQFEHEFRVRHKQGHWIFVLSRGRVVRRGADGSPLLMAGVHIDITALKEAELRLENIIAGAEAGTWQHDLRTGSNLIDARWAAMLGYALGDLQPMNRQLWLTLVHPEDQVALDTLGVGAGAHQNDSFRSEFRLRHRDGHWVWIQSRGRVTQRSASGAPEVTSGIHIDITEQKVRENALRAARDDLERALAERDNAEKRFFDVAEISADWFWETDAALRFTFISESFERTTGGTRLHIGKTLEELTGSNRRVRRSADWDWLSARMAAREPFRDFVFVSLGKMESDVWVRISGSPQFAKDGQFLGYRGVGSDVTALYLAKERAEHLATRDPLTGLANRAVFQERLRRGVEDAARGDRGGAVLMLDLDNFKSINDSFGHDAGDKLLCQVSDRLSSVIRTDDLIARLGGDEFTIMLPGAHAEEAMDVAWRLIETLSHPFSLANQSLFVSVSIGVTLYPEDGLSAVDLLQNADIAMYRAKAAGRSQFALYRPALREEQTRRSEIIQAMHRGLREERFRLVVQPKFDLATSPRIVGAEALLRWSDPDFGDVPPGQFIPLAESTGLIFEIDLMVVTLAARLLSRWQEQGLAFPVAINISAQSFQQQGIVTEILSRLAVHAVPPALLQLEITETALVTSKDVTFRNIRRLEAEGIGVVIDDFGTGYSSLSYLQELPLAELKIDQSFTTKLARGEAGTEAIVQAILNMARALGMRSVAEGVETEEQRAWLRENGCDMVQGFLLGRPSEIAEFESLHLAPSATERAGGPD